MPGLLAWRPWAAAGVAAVLFLTNLGGSHLWDEDEAKNARCGAEMHQADEWVVPTYNGELRSHKPVLLYWAMRASYAALGVSEFSARLPSALCGIAIVVMCYHLGRLLFDRTVGMLAAVLLASATMFATLSRAATPDGVLMIATTAALLAFVAGVARRRGGAFSGVAGTCRPLASFQLPWPHVAVMYAAMGVAVLAKGPIGVLLPLWAICLYGLFGEPAAVAVPGDAPSWRRFASWFAASAAPRRWWEGARAIRLAPGLAIVALVAGPWYAAVSLQTGGDWLTGFLGTHNVGRFSGAMEGHNGEPFYQLYYVVAVMAGFFPASCFLPVAVYGAASERRRGAGLAPSYAFALAIIVAWIGFFSIAATKLPNYVIPCYVGLAVATSAWLVTQARRLEAEGVAAVRSWMGAGMASCAGAGVVITIALAVVGGVLMGGPAAIGSAGLAPLAGGLVGLEMLRRCDPKRAVTAFAGAGVVFALIGQAVVAPVASPYADGPRIADAVREIERVAGPVKVATHRYTTPSVVWELDRQTPAMPADQIVRHLAEPDAVAAMTAEALESIRDRLPAGVTELAEEGRFLRTHKRIVLVGRLELLAAADDRTRLR